ncbi:MAG TPA: LysR family transcriptional regulator [Polyangiaceae bacterium]|nr:LysR family transcriptional regulator [Polyangiaceae bacterium]
MSLTLDQLRLFKCVADHGSFSAAARFLNRTQSAVSEGVSKLESTLGVPLFERTGRGPKLTPAGKAILADGEQVIERIHQLQERAANISRGLETEVSVALDALFPPGLMVEMCRAFRAQFPGVSLRIHSEVLSVISKLVIDGTCQVGVSGTTRVTSADLNSRFLCEVALVTVAASDHPLASAAAPIPTAVALNHVQVILSERGAAPAADVGVLAKSTWRVADISTKLTLLRAGLGWGNLPLNLVRQDIEAGTLQRVVMERWGPNPLLATMSTIVRKDTPLGPAGQWLLDCLEQLCREQTFV